MAQLPQEFLQRMHVQLGGEYEAFVQSYEKQPVRGLRVNTLKTSVEAFLKACPFSLSPTGILEEGFVLEGEVQGIGAHPYHTAGLFYMQEPSAMDAVEALAIKPGMKVLDLCAAPGGKSTGIAARLNGKGLLVANEIEVQRAKTLQFNMERMGAVNTVVTCAHPEVLCGALRGMFDAVLVDAPCSGEGMFRKDEAAIIEWSLAHVRTCAVRQTAILESAAQAVKRGGVLVYSTCTFSEEENERVVEAFLTTHVEFELVFMKRCYPHKMKGEGHFVARLIKSSGDHEAEDSKPLALKPCVDAAYGRFLEETFSVPPALDAYQLADGRAILLNEELPLGLKDVRMLNAGVFSGEITKGRFEPSHALFLACHGGRYKRTLDFSPCDERLSRFLRGDTIDAEGLRGFCAVTVDTHPIGFGKASEGVLKNRFPKALRNIFDSSAMHG